MKKVTIMLAVLCLLFCAVALAEDEPTEKEVKYAVLKVTDLYLDVTFVVVQEDKIDEMKAQLLKEYKNAMAEYEKAKKQAEEEGEEYYEDEPSKPEVEIIKKGLDKETAETLREKEEDKYNKSMEEDEEEFNPEDE